MYLDQSVALSALKNLPAVRGRTTAADDEFLNSLLVDSAGLMPPETTVYRIYYVAAKFLEQPGSIHVISSAEGGVKFTGLAVPIASLFALQRSEDLALGLIVPPGYEAPGEEIATPTTSTKQALPFGSGSYVLRAYP